MEDVILLEKALVNNNKDCFKKIKKADLHVHGLLGSNRKIFNKYYPQIKLETFKKNNDISSLSKFIKNNIIKISTTKEGQLSLFECTIITAITDGVAKLEMSVDYRLVNECYNNDYTQYITDLINLKNKYRKKIDINYDLGISRNAYKKEDYKVIKDLIKSQFFKSVDLYGDELSKTIKIFKKIYKLAKKNNMILKAHVGEFGSAKDVYAAMKKLKLNVVEHGISIIDNKKAIKYAIKHNVLFNVCPISNLKLNRVDDIKKHPIRKMYDCNLKITINTDDQLIFENSLFDEYMLLYKNNIFTIEELNKIRLNSF